MVIMTNDVERISADIDADHRDRRVEHLNHDVLVDLSARCPDSTLISGDPEKTKAKDQEYRHSCEKDKERDEARIHEKKIGRERDHT